MRKDVRDREKNKRSGGRAARQALRSAPLAKDPKLTYTTNVG